MGKKSYQQYGKTFRKPKRPFEKERLDAEMKMVGEYGLKNKREVLRVDYALAKIRTAARTLLTLDDKDEQRMFQGEALLRRMVRLGLLLESEKKLDYILGLSTAKIMERRLQTKVFKLQIARSYHHARVLIKQRHIRVGRQVFIFFHHSHFFPFRSLRTDFLLIVAGFPKVHRRVYEESPFIIMAWHSRRLAVR